MQRRKAVVLTEYFITISPSYRFGSTRYKLADPADAASSFPVEGNVHPTLRPSGISDNAAGF